MKILLPCDPEYHQTLNNLPVFWKQEAHKRSGEIFFIKRAGSGLMEPASYQQVNEYLEQEYDEMLDEQQDWNEHFQEVGIETDSTDPFEVQELPEEE